jgi:hypothetical protein
MSYPYPAAGGGARQVTDRAALQELAPGGSIGSSPGNEPPRWAPSIDTTAWSHDTHDDGASPEPRPGDDIPAGDDADMPGERVVPPHSGSDLAVSGLDRWPSGTTQTEQSPSSMPGGATGIAPSSSALLSMGLQSPGEQLLRVPNQGGKNMQTSWTQQSRGAGPLPAHAADSPSNTPHQAEGPLRHPTGVYTSARSMLASGHYTVPAPGGVMNLPYSTVTPTPLATIRTVSPADCRASSICDNPGQATVQQLDQQNTSAPFLAGQTGRNTPSGNPSRPGFHQAQPAMTPVRPPGYESSYPMSVKMAPGAEFTTRLPPAMGG